MADGATSADLIAYLERLRANALRVMDNTAASAEAQAQARDWFELLTWALPQGIDWNEPPLTDKLAHWHRLLERINGELRAGLHLGEAGGQAQQSVEAPAGRHGRAADISTGGPTPPQAEGIAP